MEPVIHLLYSSDYYTVNDFKCLCLECSTSKKEYTEQFSVCFVRSGNFSLNTFRDSLDTYTGYALVNKPGYEYTVTHPALLPDECTVIRFHTDFYEMLKQQTCSSSFFRNADLQSILIRLSPATEYLHTLLLQLIRSGHCSRLEADTRVIELVQQILGALTDPQKQEALPGRLKKEHLRTVEQAKIYITENLAHDISLESVSAHCCISPFHFSRIFRTFTGCSPHQYLLQVRLKHAELLLKSGKPVADTAFLSGFNSIEHFSATFKKKYKVPPSSFRTMQETQQDF